MYRSTNSRGPLGSAYSALWIALVWLIQGCAPVDTSQVGNYSRVNQGEYPISYQAAGSPGKPMVLFIHGTPGSSQAFNHLFEHPELLACCHLVAVDRVGFGESADSDVQPDFDVQAAAIAQVFGQNQSSLPITVVGHSLGGSIAARVAMNYPDKVGGLLIISSALDPELSAPRWYHRLAALPGVKYLLPRDLHRANEEMLDLKDSLEKMTDGWVGLTMPVIIIQGNKDSLVPKRNPEIAERKLPATQLEVHRFPDDGHFILWERPDFVVEQLLKLVVKPTEPPETPLP